MFIETNICDVLIVTGIAACTHPEAMQRCMFTVIRNGICRKLSAKLSGLAQITVHVFKPSVDPKEDTPKILFLFVIK